jgi:competence protein ComEC
VRFPSRQSLLVDAGGAPGSRFDIGERVVVPAVRALGVARLDVLAITHADPDHIGGAPAILRELRPREIWEGVPVPPFEPLQALASQAASMGAAWRAVQSGDSVRFGEVRVDVRHPPPPEWERQRVRNDDSLVIELRLREVSIVLTGDVGRDAETRLAGGPPFAGFRVLKAPHHGSATSSSAPFLAWARPSIVVFSAGRENRYGHPAPAVVERYHEAGAAMFRTDEDGMVLVATDGHEVRVETFTKRRARFVAR